MKILYVASSSGWGGGSKALLNLIEGLRYKHEISVLLPDTKGRLVKELQSRGITCFFTRYSLTIYPQKAIALRFLYRISKMIYFRWRAIHNLENLIRNLKPDIIHTNVGPLDIALGICEKYQIPHVWHQREYQDKDFGMTFFPSKMAFWRKIHYRGNYNIAITKGVFAHWSLRLSDRIIYDGVIDERESVPDRKIGKTVLFVGRVEKAKGLHDLISAFAEFHRKYGDYKLRIVGSYNLSSEYFQNCKKYIRNNSLSDVVEFMGERSDVYAQMSAASFLVVPSISEGFGFISVEAMYCSCLVIGRNTGGLKEQFDIGKKQTGGEIGLRFGDNIGLYKQMCFAVENDMTEMVKRARNVVLQNYTLTRYAKQVEDFYKAILCDENNVN